MKITEIAVLNESSVQEAPQGMLKRAGLGIMKKFGSAGAAGKLETGKIANQLKKAYQQHLGKTGRPSSAKELMAFLKNMGYPTQGVKKLAKQLTAPNKAPKGPLANKNDGPEQPTPGGVSAKPKANNPNLKLVSGVHENVITELKGPQLDKLLTRAAQDAAYMKSGGDVTKDTTANSKQGGNFGGAFASGLAKGYKAGRNPLKTAGDAIADKFKKAAGDYEKSTGEEPSSGSTQDTRAGLNTLRTELGLENPAMAVKALEKLQAGKPLSNKNELNAVKPIVNAVQKALQSTQGRARLKQLIKTL